MERGQKDQSDYPFIAGPIMGLLAGIFVGIASGYLLEDSLAGLAIGVLIGFWLRWKNARNRNKRALAAPKKEEEGD